MLTGRQAVTAGKTAVTRRGGFIWKIYATSDGPISRRGWPGATQSPCASLISSLCVFFVCVSLLFFLSLSPLFSLPLSVASSLPRFAGVGFTRSCRWKSAEAERAQGSGPQFPAWPVLESVPWVQSRRIHHELGERHSEPSRRWGGSGMKSRRRERGVIRTFASTRTGDTRDCRC